MQRPSIYLKLLSNKALFIEKNEKDLRVYDLNRHAAPKELAKSPASVRTIVWLHTDFLH
jgi:hypothetical protein